MNRAQWLAERKKGIGSSDAAPVCGLSRWSTALKVWLEKTGHLGEEPMTPEMEWGLRHEDAIALKYQEETRCEFIPYPKLAVHPEHGWMLATVDRMATDRVVELKTSRFDDEWGEPGTDEVPPAYLIQVMHQLEVTGRARADVAVLIGGSDFRIYTVERNDAIIADIVGIETDFWELVKLGKPPEPDWAHPDTADLVKNCFGFNGAAIELGDAEADLVDEYGRVGDEIKALELFRKATRAKLLWSMQEADMGLLPDGRRVRRKLVSNPGHVVQPYTYTDVRILAARKTRKAAVR